MKTASQIKKFEPKLAFVSDFVLFVAMNFFLVGLTVELASSAALGRLNISFFLWLIALTGIVSVFFAWQVLKQARHARLAPRFEWKHAFFFFFLLGMAADFVFVGTEILGVTANERLSVLPLGILVIFLAVGMFVLVLGDLWRQGKAYRLSQSLRPSP